MRSLDDYRAAAEGALRNGAYLLAYDTAEQGLRRFPADRALRQSAALALAQTGATREANRRLRALADEADPDEETLGMLARTYKDLWAASAEPAARAQHLRDALHWYLEAHRRSGGGYWSGINAATMALLAGDRRQAGRLAAEVATACRARLPEAPEKDRYWITATLGEAALLGGHHEDAAAWYGRAVQLRDAGLRRLVSTRRNARLILGHEGKDAAWLDEIFRIPSVAVCVGHLIDRPGRATPRFTPDLEPQVRAALRERLRGGDIGFGYSSAASGADILFLETLTELGAERHIVLPYNVEQFQEDSVAFAGGDWAARYRTVLRDAASVTIASEQRMLGGDMSYRYAFQLLDGLAAIRAEELETRLVGFAVWDGGASEGPGGTAESVAHWRAAGRTVEIVDLRAIARGSAAAAGTAARAERPAASAGPAPRFASRLVGLLFADVVGFSKLTEDQIPRFVEHYLGAVAAVRRDHGSEPLLANTWGDGLYFVFAGVRETGDFALRLRERLEQLDWTRLGLPATLALRIAVHAGPVYDCTDPITERRNFLGAHVALAARMEPITPPGAVYASSAFAALAASAGVREFRCTYVGQTPLAKSYGTMPLYVVTRGT